MAESSVVVGEGCAWAPLRKNWPSMSATGRMWPWEESGTRLNNSSGGRGRGPGERREGVGCPWQTRESLSSRGGSRWVRAWWFCGWGAQWDRTGQDRTGRRRNLAVACGVRRLRPARIGGATKRGARRGVDLDGGAD